MHVLEELKTLALTSGVLRQEPRISTRLLRDVIEQLEQLETEISVAHDLLAAAERVIHELLPYAARPT